MMLFTTASVILRYVSDWTGETDVDIMIWAFATCIFIAMPAVTLRDEHVVVDLIDHLAPRRVIRVLRWIGLAMVIAFLAISFYKAYPVALEKLEFGENTMSLDINRFWFWAADADRSGLRNPGGRCAGESPGCVAARRMAGGSSDPL